MNQILSLFPHFFACAVFFIFLALGLKLLLTSKDTIIEQFGQLYFAVMHRSYEKHGVISRRTVLSGFRCLGAFCLLLSSLGAWMIVSRLG